MRKVRIINVSEARLLAMADGYFPYEKEGNYGFAKLKSGEMRRLNWQELEKILSEKKMVICEIGGYMKIVEKPEEKKEGGAPGRDAG